jgi:WD40 repeat protein
VCIWEVATGECLTVLAGHADDVESVAWSPDGMYLASAEGWNGVRVWDAVTGESLAVLEHTEFVYSVAWSPDGTYLASGSWDGTIRLWGVPVAE